MQALTPDLKEINMHRKLLFATAAFLCFAPFRSLRAQDSKLLSLLRTRNKTD